MNFAVVTTFDTQKHPYGINFISSFLEYWPAEAKLFALLENHQLVQVDNPELVSRLEILSFEEECPDYKKFKELFGPFNRTDTYRLDAIRFAHKIYTLFYAFENLTSFDRVIWCDADIITLKDLPIELLKQISPEESHWSYLGRDFLSNPNLNYPECGLMVFNPHHKNFDHTLNAMRMLYDQGKVINLREWHDSFAFYVIDQFISNFAGKTSFDITNLGMVPLDKPQHVFIASVLGEFMDHFKGNRKKEQRSPEMLDRIKKVQQSKNTPAGLA